MWSASVLMEPDLLSGPLAAPSSVVTMLQRSHGSPGTA
jgi:hypothetical protein